MDRLKNMDREEFFEYIKSDFASDLRDILATEHTRLSSEIAASEWGQYRPLGERTIQAAVWSVLRLRLPLSWFVAVEVTYPNTRQSADILIYPSSGKPIPLEIKKIGFRI